MGRRPLAVIFFSLALLVQILAPAVAAKMFDLSGGVLGHTAAICAFVGDADIGDADNGSAPDTLPPRHDHCQFCQNLGAAAAAAYEEPAYAAAFYSRPAPRSWNLPVLRPALFGGDQDRPPRGPPSLI